MKNRPFFAVFLVIGLSCAPVCLTMKKINLFQTLGMIFLGNKGTKIRKDKQVQPKEQTEQEEPYERFEDVVDNSCEQKTLKRVSTISDGASVSDGFNNSESMKISFKKDKFDKSQVQQVFSTKLSLEEKNNCDIELDKLIEAINRDKNEQS